MQGNKKQAKNTSNNSDSSYSLLETRIKESRNTSNNSDFSNSLLDCSHFFFVGTVHFFFYQFFFSDLEQTLNDNLEFEERKKNKNETKIARIKIEDLI